MNRFVEHRTALVLTAFAVWSACGLFNVARAAPLTSQDFSALAQRCAPKVPVTTLAAVAKTESGFDPLSLHNNTTKYSEKPGNLELAVADATRWVAAGDSVDLGLMQINSANLGALNLNIRTALDACASLAGGAAVLEAAYGSGQSNTDQQVALLMALSRYNTGSPLKGIMNGYARTVMDNMPQTAPEPASHPVSAEAGGTALDSNAPPAWNVWASAAYVQSHGAAWLVSPLPARESDDSKLPEGQLASAPVSKQVLAASAIP